MDTISITEISQGYAVSGTGYSCLVCGSGFSKDQVYPSGEGYLLSEAAVQSHIREAHPDYLISLLELDKEIHGISQPQAEIIKAKFLGKSDKETAREAGKSASAVRNMRFQLKKKAREAKIFLGIMDRLERSAPEDDQFVSFNGLLTVQDDRTIVTKAEESEILSKYFDGQMKLRKFPKKEKEKLVLLNRISEQFIPGKTYSEKEVNARIQDVHEDYVTIRRYLIEYGFMDRTPDGKAYWRK